jgi:nucleoporin NDC1
MLERFVFRWVKVLPPSNAVSLLLSESFSHLMTRNAQPFVLRNLAILLLTGMLFTLSSFAIYNIAFGLARLALLLLLLRVPLV